MNLSVTCHHLNINVFDLDRFWNVLEANFIFGLTNAYVFCVELILLILT